MLRGFKPGHKRAASAAASSSSSASQAPRPVPSDRTIERPLGPFSTPAVPDSCWFVQDLLLGAGMVILQTESEKVAIINDPKRGWFLPKGRKDVGESLEQTALREAHEESGYCPAFLPLWMPHRFPLAPGTEYAKVTEPIFVTTYAWRPRKGKDGPEDTGGEYVSFYYVGYISPDAQREEGTGMADEKEYQTHLLSIPDAVQKLHPEEAHIVNVAWQLWLETCKTDAAREEYAREQERQRTQTTA